MAFPRNKETVTKINTKGFCFVCLKGENIPGKGNCDANEGKSVSIEHLIRLLQDVDFIFAKVVFDKLLTPKLIQADLCESCSKMVTRFSVLSQQLEKIQMEVNYFLERIHQRISESAEDPERIQVYSNRMKSDHEGVCQFVFVDKLRKYVAENCLTRQQNIPRVQLERIDVGKNEQIAEEESDYEEEFDDEFASLHSPSPTPSESMEHQEFKYEANSSANFDEQEDQDLSGTGVGDSTTETGKGPSQFYRKDSVTGLYCCKKCDKKYRYRSAVHQHFEKVHLKMKFKCDLCNLKEYPDKSHLFRHKRTCRQNLEKKLAKENDSEFRFVCNICGKRFKTKASFSRHRTRVHQNVRHSCDLCEKRFTSAFSLKLHKAGIHFAERFSCRFCTNVYRTLSKCSKHENVCPQRMSVADSNLH